MKRIVFKGCTYNYDDLSDSDKELMKEAIKKQLFKTHKVEEKPEQKKKLENFKSSEM